MKELECRPRTTLFALLVLGVIIAACSGARPETDSPASSAPREAVAQEDGRPRAVDREQQDNFQNDLAPKVTNRWGVTSVERYLNIDRRETTDDPYGPLIGSLTILEMPLSEWIGRSQAIVVGTVAAISPPYYNSADRGFWHEPSTEAGRSILQDLTLEVERVLGDTAGITGGPGGDTGQTVVTIAGGQIEVSFDESVDPALLPEGLEPGQTYVESIEPNVRVAEGDRVLLFLEREAAPWFGAPVDQGMPWGKSTVAGRPAVPVGTRSIVSVGHWQLLDEGDQVAEFPDRAVALDELEALAQASLGQALRDPGAPVGPGNMPGRSEPFDDPAQASDTPSQPTGTDEPPHTHPEYER